MHNPEDAIRGWSDQVSTLKMCPTFGELQGLGGDPIDFEWKISQEPHTALDILHKIQAMFNDIELERKNNEDSCALTSRKIKEYASKFNDGHSWDPEKKASGIKDMQPIMVASGTFVRHKCWTILRIQDIRYSRV